MASTNDISYETTQEDWEDFFADWDLRQGTTYPVDQDDEWLCVASQHGRIQVATSNQRLDEPAKEQKGPPPGYEFDR